MTLDNWLRDIPQQFQDKKNIKVLFDVFSKQMDELYQVYEDLKFATTLDNAKGQNLRYVGDILSTSITEAQSILMAANNLEITDETYRKVLQYKSLQNNCNCTYYDIMESINLLWDAKNVQYVEDPERPASVYIALEDASIDGVDPGLGRVLAIKPAGVAMIYTVDYLEKINISESEKVNVPRIKVKVAPMVYKEDVTQEMRLKSNVKTDEKLTFTMLLKESLWLLDGTYMLDGTKRLNAGKSEEVL